MSRLLHRNRRVLISAVPGLWMFALFVGIAHACRSHGVTSDSHHPTVAANRVDDTADHNRAPRCDEFCSNDVPLLSVLKLVQDQPVEQLLVLPAHYYVGVLAIAAPVLRLARTTHPPPGAPFSLCTVRLTL